MTSFYRIKKTGIYEIKNKSTGRMYIGSSVGVYHRISQHKYMLNKHEHFNKILQNAWNKYGENSFEMNLILLCSKDDLLFYEQLIMDGYKSHEKGFGYNIRKKANTNSGLPLSPKLFEKFSKNWCPEKARQRKTTHGLSKSKEYKSWSEAKSRCRLITHGDFKDYGGRGISVSKEWYADVGACPPNHYLGRKDINGDFDKQNCLWLPNINKTNNRRTTRNVLLAGETVTITEASRRLGVNEGAISWRKRNCGETYQDATDHFVRRAKV